MSAGKSDGEAGIDFKALGRHFEARRLELGMRPAEFAVFAGLSKGPTDSYWGSHVRALELYGKPCLKAIVYSAAALGIDDEKVRAISGLDLASMRRDWEEWAAGTVPVVMSIRAVPGFWIQKPAPEGFDHDGILAWARSEFPSHLRCIHWSRKDATYLRPDGTSYDIHSNFGDDEAGPTMSFK